MDRKKPLKTSPGKERNDWIHDKSEFGEDIPNQWSLKLKKADFKIPPEKAKESVKGEPVDLKTCLLVKKDGEASILFDLSRFLHYSIFVLNESESDITLSLLHSPDQMHYSHTEADRIVSAGQLDFISSNMYSKYVKVMIRGKYNSPVIVFLQGIKIF